MSKNADGVQQIKLKPEVGLRRLASIFIDFSIILLPTVYLTLLFTALLGTPLLFSRDPLGSINNSWIFASVFLVVLVGYLYYCKYVGKTIGKKICGLSVVMNESGAQATRKALSKRALVTTAIFIILSFTSALVVVFLWFLLFSFMSKIVGDSNTLLLSFIFGEAKNGLLRFGYVLVASIPIIYFLLYYFLFISFWKKRGLPDIIAKTRVAYLNNGWPVKKLFLLVSTLSIFYILIFPLAFYFEKTVKYTLPHPDTTISTSHLKEYKSKMGWSIQYDDVKFSPKEDSNYTIFSIRTEGIIPCIDHFTITKILDNPERKGLEQYFADLEEKNIFYFKKSPKEPIIVNDSPGWRITYQNNTLSPENQYHIRKSVSYILPAGDKIYDLRYDVFDRSFGEERRFPPEECQQNEEAIQKMFQTFNYSK